MKFHYAFTLVSLLIIGTVKGQVDSVVKASGSALDSISTSLQLDRNVEMSNLYKQSNPLSTFAPAGEIGSGKSYLFTADVNPLFVLSNSIRRKWNVAIGIRVGIRMFTDDSYPVRTPSYMPTVRIYYNADNDPESYRFGWLGFTHHSNGQDGPSIVNGEWNTSNGNFSTNWITGSVDWGDNYGARRHHYSAAIMQHVRIGDALSQDENLDDVYGQTRLDFNYQFRGISKINMFSNGNVIKSYWKEMSRWHFHLQLIAAGNKEVSDRLLRSVNIEVYKYWFLKTMKDGGFFVGGGYYGEDPYNIFFHRKYPFVKVGITAGNLFFRF